MKVTLSIIVFIMQNHKDVSMSKHTLIYIVFVYYRHTQSYSITSCSAGRSQFIIHSSGTNCSNHVCNSFVADTVCSSAKKRSALACIIAHFLFIHEII